jgi:LysM repeat protein
MPEPRSNPIARILAVVALGAAFVFVVAIIATSGGDDEGSDDEEQVEQTGPTREGQRALDNGVWVVREGDTLVSISEETGIDLDELVELNPETDPQALITGQRISLRAGEVTGSGGSDQESGDGTEFEEPQTNPSIGDSTVEDNSGIGDGVSGTP